MSDINLPDPLPVNDLDAYANVPEELDLTGFLSGGNRENRSLGVDDIYPLSLWFLTLQERANDFLNSPFLPLYRMLCSLLHDDIRALEFNQLREERLEKELGVLISVSTRIYEQIKSGETPSRLDILVYRSTLIFLSGSPLLYTYRELAEYDPITDFLHNGISVESGEIWKAIMEDRFDDLSYVVESLSNIHPYLNSNLMLAIIQSIFDEKEIRAEIQRDRNSNEAKFGFK